MPPLVDSSGRYLDTSLELRTRAGNPIENTQVWEHSRFEWHLLGEMLSRFKNAWRVSDACPVYNCHGLTLGSRRTQISPPIHSILDDDGFDQLQSEREVQPGDVVIYFDTRGEVTHSGFVVWRKKISLVAGSESIVPMIWSKWGKGYEMIHSVGECPYLEEEGHYTAYYRLRRWKPSSIRAAVPPSALTL